MKCPKCNCDSLRVIEVLPAIDTKIYRRRHCNVCDFRFNTVEVSEDEFVRTISEAIGKVVDNCSEEFKQGYNYAYRQRHPRG